MGYDLHIHRAKSWLESATTPITLAEWTGYVASSNDFQREDEQTARWTGHPTLETAWFYWWNGEVSVKDPDKHMRRKMYEVAVSLGGRVQGDEDEFYGPEGEPVD